MSESGIPYRWLLVYQDHFTKFIRLRPLKNKCAVEVADVIRIYSVNSAFLIFCRAIMGENLRTISYTLLSMKIGRTRRFYTESRDIQKVKAL